MTFIVMFFLLLLLFFHLDDQSVNDCPDCFRLNTEEVNTSIVIHDQVKKIIWDSETKPLTFGSTDDQAKLGTHRHTHHLVVVTGQDCSGCWVITCKSNIYRFIFLYTNYTFKKKRKKRQYPSESCEKAASWESMSSGGRSIFIDSVVRSAKRFSHE